MLIVEYFLTGLSARKGRVYDFKQEMVARAVDFSNMHLILDYNFFVQISSEMGVLFKIKPLDDQNVYFFNSQYYTSEIEFGIYDDQSLKKIMSFDHNKAPIYDRKVKKIEYLDKDVVMFEFLDQKIIWDENLKKEIEF